jgi:hypothetical protein
MKVEIDLPEDTLRKLKALNILMGSSDELEHMLMKMVDEAIVNKIVSTVIGKQAPAPAARAVPVEEFTHFQDLTGVSDGLGDPEPARATRRRQAPPAEARIEGGVADEALDHDLDIEDPNSEAKVEAPTFADQMGSDGLLPSAEEAFAAAADMPPPVHVPEASAPRKRRATVNTRKHVSAFTGSEQHRI